MKIFSLILALLVSVEGVFVAQAKAQRTAREEKQAQEKKQERSGIRDPFLVQDSLKDTRIPDGKISGTVQEGLGEFLSIFRRESAGGPSSLLVVGGAWEANAEGEVRFDRPLTVQWTRTTAEQVLQKLCKQLDWAIFFTNQAVVIGPAKAVRRFEEAWAKQPVPIGSTQWRAGLNWRFHRVNFRESSVAEACEFLNAKQKEIGVSPVLEFKPQIETKTRLWLDAEELSVAETARLISAAMGCTATEALGLFKREEGAK